MNPVIKKRAPALRLAGYVCLALAVILLGAVTWTATPHLDEAFRWKKVEAEVVRSEFVKDHDSKGMLQFDFKVLFRYEAEGKSHLVLANSNLKSHNFAWVIGTSLNYLPNAMRTIIYRPGNPEDIRFEAGFTWRNFRYPVAFAGCALVLLIAALILFRLARPLPKCKACQAEIERDFKYCPFCAAALESPVPIGK
jgi:hypothetical protein